MTSFARVQVVNEAPRVAGPMDASPAAPSGLIEIAVPGGATIRVDAQMDEHAVRRVLAVLRG